MDTIVSVAFKNCVGQYDLKRVSIFEITNISKYFELVNIKCTNNKEIEFQVKCPICGEYHYYTYRIGDFIKTTMVIGGCEKVGLPIFFIGKTEKVEEKINKYNEVNKEIYAMF
ncbi:hypothetical protein [Clostridium ganghwense]|uniref:Uncharacterized protein n=1 Tax=Clostridium ganghwense TaxID=312089 RepID=A0ABT4CPD4_9CLOT|nr:hypothetical protein [Clostridium ganghwense]MCY6369839.1 hypothetical protein [Clostridium ganghwense]